MFNIREMKPEDKAVIMPMVSTFYHSPAVEHDVDTAVLERTFDAATDPTMPYISGLVMLEDEKVVGYGYVTGYYASEVGRAFCLNADFCAFSASVDKFQLIQQ